ncbi:MAG: imidazole glycerol phosphate synthase subunit HisH [Candidatus Omnitrophota bacterium]
MIAIIDYGMGNIHSVKKALEHFGAKTIVTNNPKEIGNCEKAILPGVGAFDDAMSELKNQKLISAINEHIRQKKAFLGICLGMQLLLEKSEEANRSKGLGIFKGSVKRFEDKKGFPVPHIGWNQLKIKRSDSPLLKDLPDNSYVYFCHSYYPKPQDPGIIATTTGYGFDFASILWKNNIYGTQFHPEKSQKTGLKMLKNFVTLC